MIYSPPGQSFQAVTTATTGLVGTLGVRIMDGVGGTTTVRTTAGIVESPATSGVYIATLTAPSAAGDYVVTWDTGGLTPTWSAEPLVVTSSTPATAPASGWWPDYVTLAQLKSALGNIADSDDDTELAMAISAASRAIDQHCGRQFGLLAATETRYYGAFYDRELERWAVRIDDLMTTTGLVVKTDDTSETFPTTLALDTDFRLAPYNAAGDARPWTLIVGSSSQTLSRAGRTVEVTARWGWSAVPAVVVEAALIQSERLFKRKDAPFGVAGSPEIGSEVRLLERLDPDVAMLVNPLRRARRRFA